MTYIILTSKLCNVLTEIMGEVEYLSSNKTVGFISNAVDVYKNKSFVLDDRQVFLDTGFKLLDIDLRDIQKSDLEDALNKIDTLFVSGGNTFYLLEQIRKSGLDILVQGFLDSGKCYIGSSAGSIVLGETTQHIKTLDNPDAADLVDFSGLNIVKSHILPHYGKEKYLERSNAIIEEYGEENMTLIRDDEYMIILV